MDIEFDEMDYSDWDDMYIESKSELRNSIQISLQDYLDSGGKIVDVAPTYKPPTRNIIGVDDVIMLKTAGQFF